jgi:hypothetical protein
MTNLCRFPHLNTNNSTLSIASNVLDGFGACTSRYYRFSELLTLGLTCYLTANEGVWSILVATTKTPRWPRAIVGVFYIIGAGFLLWVSISRLYHVLVH